MTTDPPGFFDDAAAGYGEQLHQALETHLNIVRRHAEGVPEDHPWDFEAALVALRWIADELRRLRPDDDAIPF